MHWYKSNLLYVSESDILGPIAYFKRYWEFGIVWKGYVWRLQS